MKAEEIRASYERLKDTWTPEAQNKYWLLHEIAAQLAELNENLGRVICQPPAYTDQLSAIRVQQR